MKQLYINKHRRLICALIVVVFALVTAFEPLIAAAEEVGNDQTQTQGEIQEQMEPQSQSQEEGKWKMAV